MIRGYFDPNVGWGRPLLSVGLFLPNVSQQFEFVDFLIDTGATATVLHPGDAIHIVGINPKALASPQLWAQQQTIGGIGGAATIYIEPASYGFFHEDGTPQLVQGNICIAQPTSANRSVPSLLGWDVLQHFKLTLEWSTKTITLD